MNSLTVWRFQISCGREPDADIPRGEPRLSDGAAGLPGGGASPGGPGTDLHLDNTRLPRPPRTSLPVRRPQVPHHQSGSSAQHTPGTHGGKQLLFPEPELAHPSAPRIPNLRQLEPSMWVLNLKNTTRCSDEAKNRQDFHNAKLHISTSLTPP